MPWEVYEAHRGREWEGREKERGREGEGRHSEPGSSWALCADVPEHGGETGDEEHVNREVKTSRRSEE